MGELPPTPTPLPVPGARAAHEPLPRFGLVLLAFFVEMILAPVVSSWAGGLLILRVVTVMIMTGALAAAGARRTHLLLFSPLLVAQLVILESSALKDRLPLVVTATILHLLALGYVFGFIVLRVAGAKDVSLDTVAGAACAWLLISLVWGDFYFLLELWHPGSFKIPEAWIIGSNRDLREALTYFSFVMMTTVGHVFDVTDAATGMLCAAESLFGMLVLACLIGRIVGLSTSQRSP